MNAVPLGSVLLSLESGARPKGGSSSDSGEIPSLGGEHVGIDGGFRLADVKRIPRPFFEAMRVGHIAIGDILVVKDGATTGKTSFVRDGFPFVEAAVNEHVFRLRIDGHRAWPAYVFHYLYSPRGQSQIHLDFRGATVGGISRDFVSKVFLPLPSVSEQRRIAEVLDRAEALRAKRRSVLAQLETLTQSVFLDMFGDPAINPKKWAESRVGEVASVQSGLALSSARESLPCEIPYLRVANVHRGYLDLSMIKTIGATEAEVAKTTLAKGDLLVVEGHGNPDEIGRAALWDGSVIGCVHQNHIIRVRFDATEVAPVYGCVYLNSPGGRRHFLRSSKTTSGLNTISVSQVRSAPLALPPLDLQQEFARRVAAVEAVRLAHRASLAKFDSLFVSLQHRAFRGEL